MEGMWFLTDEGIKLKRSKKRILRKLGMNLRGGGGGDPKSDTTRRHQGQRPKKATGVPVLQARKITRNRLLGGLRKLSWEVVLLLVKPGKRARTRLRPRDFQRYGKVMSFVCLWFR